MVGPVRPQFVLFGSSIVEFSFGEQGWGAILAHLYARKVVEFGAEGHGNRGFGGAIGKEEVVFIEDCNEADVILRGYAGWNTRRALQVLDTIFPKDATIQPSLVIVYFGGNDSTHPHPPDNGFHVPLQEYIENMRKIAIHLKSLSKKTRMIFLSCPPINEAQMCDTLSDLLGQLRRTNEHCRIYSEACLELCCEMNVEAIDLWSALQQRHDWLDVCFTDGIHLSNEGSKIVAAEILKVLREAEWEPSLYWKSMPIEFAEYSTYGPIGADEKTPRNVSNLKGNSQLE